MIISEKYPEVIDETKGYVVGAGNDCVQLGDKYFKIYYDCTNYQPFMWEPKYYHYRNIVERERKEISKEKYDWDKLGPEPISHTEPPECY